VAGLNFRHGFYTGWEAHKRALEEEVNQKAPGFAHQAPEIREEAGWGVGSVGLRQPMGADALRQALVLLLRICWRALFSPSRTVLLARFSLEPGLRLKALDGEGGTAGPPVKPQTDANPDAPV
jgi:hypothetical protein